MPLQFEEFGPLRQWWDNREENAQAWRVNAEEILAAGCNLDLKNPHARNELVQIAPKELVAGIRFHEERILTLLGEIEAIVNEADA